MEFCLDQLTEKIIEICKRKQGTLATLDGEWGTGKTYYWNETISKRLQNGNCKTAYVSLFGKESVTDIQNDITAQVLFQKNPMPSLKIIHKLRPIIEKLSNKYFSIDLTTILTVLSPETFEGTVICIDDFERLSNKVDYKDIMGFLAVLKEQKQAKILLIKNQNKFDDNTRKEEMEKFSEKIIDYELHYLPTIKDQFSATSTDNPFNKDLLLNTFHNLSISNIRTMKRVMNALNDFKFILELPVHEQIIDDFVVCLIKVVSNYVEFNFIDYKELQSYFTKTVIGTSKEKDPEKDKILSKLGNKIHIAYSSETEIVISYLTTSLIDKEYLIELLVANNEKHIHQEIYEKLNDLYFKYCYDLNYPFAYFDNDFYNLIQEKIELIHKAMRPENIIFYINFISNIDNSVATKYDNLCKQIMKNYLNELLLKAVISNYDEKDIIVPINNKFPELVEEFNQKRLNKYFENKSRIDLIEEIIENILNNKGWHKDNIIILNSIEIETYRGFMLERKSFVENSFDFIKSHQGSAGNNPFSETCDKLVAALDSIYINGGKDQQNKIDIMRRYFQVTKD